MIEISTQAEYCYAVERGFNPLFDLRFSLSFSLRLEIQKELFFGTVTEKNQRYYLWNWENKSHRCEECNTELYFYDACYISHILSRSSHLEMAHDPRNCNILCKIHHSKWEHYEKRKEMRIYQKNLEVIELLKFEYAK